MAQNNNKITTPTLVVDKSRCVANIRRMSQKARAAHVKLRPHCKTHACLEIARWLREEGGVQAITVSSLSMAEYFSDEWSDIAVAFPVNILEIDTINRLASKIKYLNLLVENVEAVAFLEQHIERNVVGVWMKIDVGYGRTGVPADDFPRIESILQLLKNSRRMKLQGFLTHAGHTYHCHNEEQVLQIHNQCKAKLLKLKERYANDFPSLQLSVGDTPSCSMVDASELEYADEMRPGNFVFYDLEQESIGSCQEDDIAVAVACPIVAKHPQRRELVIYGGGVHFSKDRLSITEGQSEGTIFGRVVARKDPSSLNWSRVIPGMYLSCLSQEHGRVVVPEELWDQFQVGDLIFVLPIHSCMTADALKHKGYVTTEGEQLERMKN